VLAEIRETRGASTATWVRMRVSADEHSPETLCRQIRTIAQAAPRHRAPEKRRWRWAPIRLLTGA
jgi:hypothetical protein